MELAEFILDKVRIKGAFPDLARAPPRKQFERYLAPVGELAYGPHADEEKVAFAFDQTRPERDEDYNQDPGW